ncbi:MAG: NAD-glutamate dehydrogenase domain-containing protein, partial [Pseudomonadota bacterium]
IALTPEIKSLLGLDVDKAPPNDIIRAILRTPVELFWLGGIGTYFKATDEEDWQVGDRGNDGVRINAADAGAKVIGEGANLGLTQDARIEFARAGGRINTDAIDNSAGVDSSDHEVNIKILLSSVIERGELQADERNDLLSRMTDDVSRHVLVHNYEQTRALSQREATAADDLDSHTRLMAALERVGRLDRQVENLPDAEQLTALRTAGQGMTRPEISILLAYAKNWLFEELLASDAPDDNALESELVSYFPETLHQYREAIAGHRLRREIIATRLANEIVDTCGPSFPFRAADATGARLSEIALAYEAARRVLNLGAFANAVDALDNKIGAAAQIKLYNAASTLLREQMYRIASDARTMAILETRGISGIVEDYAADISGLKAALPTMLPAQQAENLRRRAALWRDSGAPEEIADEAALMPSLELAFDVVNLAKDADCPVGLASAVFFTIGDALCIDAARNASRTATRADYYEKIAMRRLTEDLAIRQASLALNAIRFIGASPEGDAGPDALETQFAAWRASDEIGFSRFDRFITELEIGGGVSVAKMSLLNRKLFDLDERLRAK